MATFAVCYPPVENESFIGYVLRILDINGYSDIRVLSQILNCKLYKASFTPGTKEFYELVNVLAPCLKLNDDIFLTYFMPNARLYKEARYVQDIAVYTPKLCPLCIKEKLYFQDGWQILDVTHCAIHEMMLLDQCPNCHAPFDEWYCFLFQGCPYCGCKWYSFGFDRQPLPTYQSATLNVQQQDALWDTLLFTLRPIDLMFRSLQGIEIRVDDVVKRLEVAYALLTHPAQRKAWIEHAMSANDYHFEPSFEGQSIETIIEHKSQFFQQVTSSTDTVDLQVIPFVGHLTHRRNKVAESGTPFQCHLGLKEIAFILGLTTNDINQLTDNRVIQPLDAQAILRDQLFSLNAITNLLDLINDNAHPVESDIGLIQVHEFLPFLRYFGLSAGSFFSIFPSLKGRYYRNNLKSNWLDLLVNYDEMIQVLDDLYLSLLPENVDKKSFQSIYGLSDEQMDNLIKNTDLHYSNWKRTQQCIHKNVIVKFCSQFIVLNRIAKLKQKNVHIFVKELAEMGIFPELVLNGTRDVFLYSIHDKEDVFSKS